MTALLTASTDTFIETLRELGGRGYVVRRQGQLVASHPKLEALAEMLREDERDYLEHEGLFFEVGPNSGALFGAFVHRTVRGQGAGGLRHWPYPTVEAFVRDGLRLAAGMTRKNALAGLWWGGGKGIICRRSDRDHRDPAYRAQVYGEYGDFVSSLRGCYVTAEDAGTTPPDMREVFAHTRHTTCVPPAVGGSGNPSGPTARGVIAAMEGALDELGLGTLEGKRVAMQGAGNVATFMMEGLLERGVAQVIATDINPDRITMLRERFSGQPVELRLNQAGDTSIFAEACDIFAPNALGGVLNPENIAALQTKIVCGAANNQLLDDQRDMAALDARGITYVPDFLCNRMGIVNCANEQYGQVPNDPAIERHLERDWENSVFVVTKRVLASAKAEGISSAQAANQLADELSLEPHPIWGHRGAQIIAGLVNEGWAGSGD
jgi:glutamate dehydrogenase/leucine dehydrogenase